MTILAMELRSSTQSMGLNRLGLISPSHLEGLVARGVGVDDGYIRSDPRKMRKAKILGHEVGHTVWD